MGQIIYNEDEMQLAIVRGVSCLFTKHHIMHITVPGEHYRYEVRQDEGFPSMVERGRVENEDFYGTIVSDIPLIPSNKSYILVDDECFMVPAKVTVADAQSVDEDDEVVLIYPGYSTDAEGITKFTDLGAMVDFIYENKIWDYTITKSYMSQIVPTYCLGLVKVGKKPIGSSYARLLYDVHGKFLAFDGGGRCIPNNQPTDK